ncbi:hypothetical protein BD309DRAFT_669104 [Dichomitus squalens]|nr:hypothetical protein BD309DRAFT_669104 [Dichomitus squalens]
MAVSLASSDHALLRPEKRSLCRAARWGGSPSPLHCSLLRFVLASAARVATSSFETPRKVMSSSVEFELRRLCSAFRPVATAFVAVFSCARDPSSCRPRWSIWPIRRAKRSWSR